MRGFANRPGSERSAALPGLRQTAMAVELVNGTIASEIVDAPTVGGGL
jgi:hypothetical protein